MFSWKASLLLRARRGVELAVVLAAAGALAVALRSKAEQLAQRWQKESGLVEPLGPNDHRGGLTGAAHPNRRVAGQAARVSTDPNVYEQ